MKYFVGEENYGFLHLNCGSSQLMWQNILKYSYSKITRFWGTGCQSANKTLVFCLFYYYQKYMFFQQPSTANQKTLSKLPRVFSRNFTALVL